MAAPSALLTAQKIPSVLDDIAHDAQDKQDDDMRIRLPEQQHAARRQNDCSALRVIAEIHDLRLVETVPHHTADRCEKQHGDGTQRQVQPLQESIIAADLQDIKADSKIIQNRAELRYQRAEEHQPEIPVSEDVVLHSCKYPFIGRNSPAPAGFPDSPAL